MGGDGHVSGAVSAAKREKRGDVGVYGAQRAENGIKGVAAGIRRRCSLQIPQRLTAVEIEGTR